MLETDVLLVSFDHERKVFEPFSDLWKNPMEQKPGMTHSRYAPDTQNCQNALMQKIMIPVKPWCDHAEGFESDLRAWEPDRRRMGTCVRNFSHGWTVSAGHGTGADDDNKGKGKQVDVLETNQSSETASTLPYPSQTPSTIAAPSCKQDLQQEGWIVTLE